MCFTALEILECYYVEKNEACNRTYEYFMSMISLIELGKQNRIEILFYILYQYNINILPSYCSCNALHSTDISATY
jgi:hypothetical protein